MCCRSHCIWSAYADTGGSPDIVSVLFCTDSAPSTTLNACTPASVYLLHICCMRRFVAPVHKCCYQAPVLQSLQQLDCYPLARKSAECWSPRSPSTAAHSLTRSCMWWAARAVSDVCCVLRHDHTLAACGDLCALCTTHMMRVWYVMCGL